MVVDIAATFANVFLSVWLIPWLGFVGAPIAQTACDILRATGVICLACRDPDFRRCWHGFTMDAFHGWSEFLKLACPSFWLQNVEWWTWDLQTFIAGFISKHAQAVQSIAPNIGDLQYAVGASFSIAGSTVIGNLLGEGRAADARRTSTLIMYSVLVLMLVQLCIFLTIRNGLPYLFTQDQTLIGSIITLYPITLAFSFLDGHQAAFTGVLVGAGKQWIATPVIV